MKKELILIFLFLPLLSFSQNKLTITSLMVDYKENPIGIGNATPSLAWKLSSMERNTLQTAYEIRVALNSKDLIEVKNLSWNTKKVNSDKSVFINYTGAPLNSRTRYYWQVRIWDNHGNVSPWSEVNFWETGLLKTEDWAASWIEAEKITNGEVGPVPIFAKTFTIQSPVKSARLYITSHGLYEAKLNGSKISNHLLKPGWTSYHKRLQYQVYDVSSLLKEGKNSAMVTIGDGWYRGFLQWSGKRNFYGKEVGLLYQLEITYHNGKKQTVVSDESWKSIFDGPIKGSDIYNGEIVDSRIDESNIEKMNWGGVRVMDYALDNLVAQEGPPVIKHEQFTPSKMWKTEEGETIIDFGQNLVGWIQLKLKGERGDTVTINHAEVLDKDGNFYTENLRSALQENKFILNGQDQILEPRFTFQGFRYAKISGYKGRLDKNNLTAVAIYSDMQQTGSFTSSNELVNQLQHNIQWGQKGNFVDIPTDCPQRDERIGWTGDAQVFFNTAAFNMDVSLFFKKWLNDLDADQYDNGNVPAVIPFTTKRGNDGSAGWSDAATIIPWHYYLHYGDKSVLERQYESMKAWVEFVGTESEDNLWKRTSHYGDWLFYTMANDRDGKAAITDKTLIAQTFYAASTQNLINAAKVLGKENDVQKYADLLKDIKAAFLKEFVTPSGRLVSSSQTAYVLALNFDLLPEELRHQAAQRLVDNIKSYNNHLTTGFLGTPYLNQVLTRFGHTDIAYKLLLQDTYPSWLYPITKGATTIWERWDGIMPDGTFQTPSMNSFNHYAYGAVGDWMYQVIAGINNDTLASGYKNIVIAPKLGGDFTSATGELETLYGKVKSSWKMEKDGKMHLNVVIPPSTRAKVLLPKSNGSTVSENGTPLSKSKAIETRVNADGDIECEVGSGNYVFEYAMSN